MEARALIDEKPFARSGALFETLVRDLAGEPMLGRTEADVERWVNVEALELMRQLLQDHVDLRHAQEQRVAGGVRGADGVARRAAREVTTKLKTSFGPIEITRESYGTGGAQSLRPMDAALNLPVESYSLELQRQVARHCAQVSFESAAANVEDSTAAHLPHRQVEQTAVRAAQDFATFYAERRSTGGAVADAGSEILVLTTDAKGVIMRKVDLRAATRKLATARVQKLSKRLSRGEKRGAKRMAAVAAVYTIDPFVRTPEQIAGELRRDGHNKPVRPRPQGKVVWASVKNEVKDVFDDLFAEALHRDPTREKSWVALVDGNATQLELLRLHQRKHQIDLHIVVDVIHVLEYVWKAAWCFHDEGSPDAEAWVTERLLMILRGKSSDVAAGMRRSATLRGLSRSRREAVDTCANYLLKYRAYLRYEECLAHGWPIATGVIEGACRYLVKDRMEITGASWRLAGAEAVLQLRALFTNGDFHAYWQFHENAELQRNHLARYAEHRAPVVVGPAARRAHLRVVK